MRSRVEDLKAEANFYLKIKGIGLNFYWKLSFSNKCCCSVGGSDNKVTLAWTKCSNHIRQKGSVFCLIPSLNRVEQGGAHCCLFCHRSPNLYFYSNTLSGIFCKVCILFLTFRHSYPFAAIQNMLPKGLNTQVSDWKSFTKISLQINV